MIRKKCIFCNDELVRTYFEHDYENYIAHYQVDVDKNIDDMIKIPYNILICDNCKTPQIKYLGDPAEIYAINHADSTGTTMINLHKKTTELIIKYKSYINNIIEIGSSYGVLSDMIIEKLENIEYNIIEPKYMGDTKKKIIYNDFYENVDDSMINANTLIISHVFEHFYHPKLILEKINSNNNITNFFLIFPDLEYYINNNVLHVLNTEHTFYVDNDFLVGQLEKYGFCLIEKEHHMNHSVIFYFKKIKNIKKSDIIYVNKNYNLDKYFGSINATVSEFNKIINNNKNTQKIYMWPSSIHTLFLFTFGLKYEHLTNLLDNSRNKINKKMYGTNLIIKSFEEVIKINDKDSIILLNGGIFNKEILDKTNNSLIKFVFSIEK